MHVKYRNFAGTDKSVIVVELSL